MMDDTLLRKAGRKVHGAGWRRDPLGPKFQTNLAWSQRHLQISAALPSAAAGPCSARAIPIDWRHCPTPPKPRKNAAAEIWKAYAEKRKQECLSVRAAAAVQDLRQGLDEDDDGRGRELILSGDGGYTNSTVLKGLPPRTVFVGRIRKDAKLFALPDAQAGRGRTRCYGTRLATPEQMRRDEAVPWREVEVWAAGQIRSMKIKVVAPVRWNTAGGKRNLCLVIIKPVGYRLRKKSPVLYRDAAYVICTKPDLDPQWIVQYFLWRWEIEMNFRDEKTLIGAGQAQVRTPKAVETVPAFLAAAYATLLLAAHRSMKAGALGRERLPAPKWRKLAPDQRLTTAQAINLLRADVWGDALGVENLSGFASPAEGKMKPQKLKYPINSAVYYAQG
ncbi:MAG: hypothetical protein NTX50_30120 [Candidatus Sumerlaeota bacterium]|nr:hypothetical protein [Candidatus Sumerlaeota bacterium]